MRETKNLIVISDIHLSIERERGLFRADFELAEFLKWIYEETENCTLALNGDVLDFLVDENGSKTTVLSEAKGKVKKIIEQHSEVFDGLRKLVNSPNHQLIILSGNHDPELTSPIVQSVIEKQLCGTTFKSNIHWVTGGQGFLAEIGDCRVLIEHGDLFDDFNRIDYSELHRTIAHLSRMLDYDNYEPPPGSSLVESLSPLRQKYPWIDYIKPLSFGTFPLIWAFAEQELEYDQTGMFRKVIIDGIGGGSNRFIRKIKDLIGFNPLLAEGDEVTELFTDWRMNEIQEPLTLTKDQVIQLIGRLKKVSSKDKSFDINSPERNSFKAKYLRKYAEQGQVSAVIHGHTHSAKSYHVGKGKLLYLNSGTWGRLLRLPEKDDSIENWKSFLAKLEASIDESFNRLTFIQVTEGTPVKASLCEWTKGKVETLSTKHLSDRTKIWQEAD